MSRVDSHHGEAVGLGIAYEGYGSTTDFYGNGQYNGIVHNQGPFSPPTPRSTTDEDSVRRTSQRSQAVAPATPSQRSEETPHKVMPRILKTPRSRKQKAGKADKPKTPKLTAPLSVLTEGSHIKVKDMEEWVNRPVAVRRMEAEKRDGYVTRPMNSFMLYRSAYADRAKSWCLQNNHQVVSSVAGESWPLEPAEIRDMYNEFAKIERINHQNAHPSYKFSPSKTTAPAKKRKNEWSEDDELSDIDDAEWAPGSGRSRRRLRGLDRSQSHHYSSLDTQYFDRSFGSNSSGMDRSSWDTTNGSRSMPMPMGFDPYNQYYQTVAYPNMHMHPQYAEDMRTMRRQDSPHTSMQFTSDQGLLGLPGGSTEDLMSAMTPFDDGQLDPILLAYSGGHADIDPVALQHPGYHNDYSGMVGEKTTQTDLDSLLELGNTNEEYRAGSWQPDPAMTPLEPDSEFDKWM
ncbi:hypothetical protein ACN47E_005161 [Coniothyrium glycines]